MRDRNDPPRKPPRDDAKPASPWPERPPPRQFVDKNDRLRRAEAGGAARPARRDETSFRRDESRVARSDEDAAPISRRYDEARFYGVNACLTIFERRPQDVRKIYLTEARIAAFKPVLAWCVKNRVGYRVVEETDLDKLTDSRHHEGVCFDVLRAEPLSVAALLARTPRAPEAALLLWLDGVGNPHNLGAVLRSAAHFGAAGVILPADSSLAISGAAARVAEGGAESVPIARAANNESVGRDLRAAGFLVGATVPREGRSLYAGDLPARLALVFGAESEGMSDALIASADVKLTIPGRGAVESLNVAASVAVVVGEWFRQHATR